MLLSRSVILFVAIALGLAKPAFSGDWPQILGSDRNGVAVGEKLFETWPNAGPKVAWKIKIGSGYAGPAVLGKTLVLFHRVEQSERIEAFNTENGQRRWKVDFPATYRGGINPDRGPRCVPIIHDGRVICFGASGHMYCVSLKDGEKRWSRALYKDYRGLEGYFGAGASPIVAGAHVLVNVGGRDTAGLVALKLKDGKTAWKKTNERASYSSPTKARFNGKDHVIFVTRLNVVSVNAKDGSEYFRFQFGRSGPTVNAATPLVFGNQIFVSASYGVGARLSTISASGAKEVWANDESMSSQYNTAVYHAGYLYGTHGREDGFATYRCIQSETGKVQWSTEDFGVANTIRVKDKLLILTHEGQLVLANAKPKSFQKLASGMVGEGSTRSLPALANGHFYFRTNQGAGGELKCLVVGDSK